MAKPTTVLNGARTYIMTTKNPTYEREDVVKAANYQKDFPERLGVSLDHLILLTIIGCFPLVNPTAS
jgi:hypothetical protein